MGGMHPMRTLPIILDVGTNNKELLRDPLYIGWRHERIAGAEYYNFVDEFVEAVKTEMPNVCLQWEDFATPHARPLLEKYRNEILTFNDDVQGTAAVALGAVIGALNVVGQSLRDQKIVFLGAGSAGIGVADYLRAAMVKLGLSDDEACRKFYIVDKDGLLHDRRTNLLPEQSPYAQPWSTVKQWPRTMDGNIGLADVVGQISASVLIGLSAVGGAFKQEIIETMAAKVARPIIFPLSNPTSRAEATPQDLLSWTKGRALIATGSPFSNVSYNGQKFSISQCNNVYIFPAVGLALMACGASRVTDAMLIAAAEVLGSLSPAIKDAREPLLPRMRDVRKVAAHIAFAVGRAAIKDGVAPVQTDDQLKQAIEERQWCPSYE
jgi:malate dehydrogenase (oxaloacetate-decarboxylating)